MRYQTKLTNLLDIEKLKLLIKVQGRSELKFFIDAFLGHPEEIFDLT